MRRLKILTWHTHGSYLYYLSQLPHDFLVLSRPGRPPGYGSLGRAVIEAMMVGMPVVALATAEIATVIDDGAKGFTDTRVEPRAQERFSIDRFSADWDAAFRHVTGPSLI